MPARDNLISLPSVGRATSIAENEIAYRSRRAPLRSGTVLLESFAGNGTLCNPDALFRAASAAQDLSNIRFVWVLSAHAWADRATSEYADNPRVTFVRRRSSAYYRVLGTAQYLINNATFPHAFAKRLGQVYLNTWHGTPVKAMGYDMPGGGAESVNIVRNFLAADYLLAPNDQTAAMYRDAYRLRNVGRASLLRVGTPRIDRQFASEPERAATRSRLGRYGISLADDGVRTIVFAPTWRGSFAAPDDDIDRVCEQVQAIAAQLDSRSRLLVKVHQRVYSLARTEARLRGLLLPNEVPTNDVLALTDILISDYSSVVVDFLATGRPVVIFAPDLTQYGSSRGLNFEPTELGGPLCRTVPEVAAALRAAAAAPSAPRDAARERFCPREDGGAAARVIDIVFRRRAGGTDDVQPCGNDGRRSLLIHIGGLQANGITSSALSLVGRLDYSRFDVSVTYPQSSGDAERIEQLLDPRVRLLPRLGGTTWTRVRHTCFPFVGGRLPVDPRRLATDPRMTDEWMRCFGESRFDNTVDFGGYSAFYAKLLHAGAAPVRSTWLHNDIGTEMRSRDRSAWLRANLRRTSSLYRVSDYLVSVSPSLAELNATRIGHLAPSGSFVFARNTVDSARIRRLAAEPPPEGPDGQVIPPAQPGTCTFVTVGRLSEQKNHLRLIEAFARVHAERPDTRLVIVGAGPTAARLRRTRDDLGLAAVITLAGAQRNPFAVLARSDCFVLTSDYEGQPMVLLEALAIGLPVVSTDFESVTGAIPGGAALVVRRDTAAVADGMRAFLRGGVSGTQFDVEAYNAEAVAEFYHAIGAGANSG